MISKVRREFYRERRLYSAFAQQRRLGASDSRERFREYTYCVRYWRAFYALLRRYRSGSLGRMGKTTRERRVGLRARETWAQALAVCSIVDGIPPSR